jgi:hypothetical protein
MTGSDCSGSASATGALNVNAATNPSDADTAVSAFASRSILTNAPSLTRFQAVLLSASVWLAKIVTPEVDVTKQLIKIRCFSMFRNMFHLEFDVTRRTTPHLWCSNALGALDNVI